MKGNFSPLCCGKKKRAGAEKEQDRDDKMSLQLRQPFVFSSQQCRPLCPELWKGDG